MKAKPSKEIEELKKKVSELTIENDRFKKIYEISNTLRSERNIDKLLPLILSEISKFINAERSSLFLLDYDNRYLWTKFAEGMGDDRIIIEMKLGLVGSCVLTRQLVNVAYAYNAPYFNEEIDKKTGYRTESVLCAALFDKYDKVIGALELLNKKTGVFLSEDEEAALKTASIFKSFDLTVDEDLTKAKAVIHELRDKTQADRSSLFLLDKLRGELRSVMADDIEGWDISLSLNLGIAGLVAVTGEDINIPDAYADQRFDKSVDENTGYRTRSLICIPLRNQAGEILGVVEALNKIDGVFTDYDREILTSLSTHVAMSVENALLFDEQIRQFKSILEVLAASIDAKDPLTAGHSKKVAEYSIGIGRELGFGDEDIDILNVAALLHDYGKLAIDDHVLKKPGKLTKEEFDHIRQHTVSTRCILDKMSFVRKYKKIPLLASSHHERLDGSGYEGLTDNQIPFMAKILAVADVFEALTAKRHYRDALPPEEAFKILDQEAGSKLNQDVIVALKSYWDKLDCRQ
jgi:GAF domain-containing protein